MAVLVVGDAKNFFGLFAGVDGVEVFGWGAVVGDGAKLFDVPDGAFGVGE